MGFACTVPTEKLIPPGQFCANEFHLVVTSFSIAVFTSLTLTTGAFAPGQVIATISIVRVSKAATGLTGSKNKAIKSVITFFNLLLVIRR